MTSSTSSPQAPLPTRRDAYVRLRWEDRNLFQMTAKGVLAFNSNGALSIWSCEHSPYHLGNGPCFIAFTLRILLHMQEFSPTFTEFLTATLLRAGIASRWPSFKASWLRGRISLGCTALRGRLCVWDVWLGRVGVRFTLQALCWELVRLTCRARPNVGCSKVCDSAAGIGVVVRMVLSVLFALQAKWLDLGWFWHCAQY